MLNNKFLYQYDSTDFLTHYKETNCTSSSVFYANYSERSRKTCKKEIRCCFYIEHFLTRFPVNWTVKPLLPLNDQNVTRQLLNSTSKAQTIAIKKTYGLKEVG